MAMSDFNLTELLPFYLDETDEHIAALNNALLRLEQDSTDAKALQEAFRMFHSIKGASVVMGFTPVNQLNHHLESLFDQLRSRRRELDRITLDLTFRCLDELRDYHRDLRAQGQSTVDLSGLIQQVVNHLHQPPLGDDHTSPAITPQQQPAPTASTAKPPDQGPSPSREWFEEPGATALIVIFQPNLPLADMKARLVLNRLAARARILSTEPPMEQLEEADHLTRFTVFLSTEVELTELHDAADVEGVVEIRVKPLCPRSPTPLGDQTTLRSKAPATPTQQPGLDHPNDAQAPTSSSSNGNLKELASTSLVPEGAPIATTTTILSAQPATTPRKAKIAETIRVDSDRLDYLMNLAGELVITKARFVAIARSLEDLFRGSSTSTLTSNSRERLESIARSLDGLAGVKASSTAKTDDRWSVDIRRLRDNFRAIQDELDLIRLARDQVKSLSETIHSLGRVSDSLQKGVLDTRMVPIGPLFERFRRVVRDLSFSSGKEVTLQIDGEKTELDKRMIDELSDPLIHMVRNAVDHGLEPPSQREAAGKPRSGALSLLASHRGNSVVITVSDDGRGIDCGRIRQKIIAKGLMTKTEADALADRELIAFIWHPGLSTAETVTEISGRGVGMDIVKSRIENLSGTVDVRSTVGQGTTFTIRLPLTLAIMSSLLVRIYEEVYAIPLDHIDEIVEVRPEQIYHVQGQPAIEIRKKIITLIALGDVFRWGGKDHPAALTSTQPTGDTHHSQDEASPKQTVVVVQNGETTIGLLVDQLIGMQEVVLKSLEKNFRTIPGLSGASILGDGRVSLILDLDTVLNLVSRQPAHHGP
jgi:two-component system chemotaxis sensor kinase CheA